MTVSTGGRGHSEGELRLEEVRQEVQKGIDSGESSPLDMEAIKALGHQRLAEMKAKE